MYEILCRRIYRRKDSSSYSNVCKKTHFACSFFFFSNRHLPELRSILLDITNKLEGRTAGRQLPEGTKAKPFNFTVPKARTVPVPKTVRIKSSLSISSYSYIQIPKIEKPRPPPKSTYEPPKDPIELEKIREENHRQVLHKLNQTRSFSYHFMQTEKSTKTLNKQIKPTEENIRFRANPPPSKTQVYFPPSRFSPIILHPRSTKFR